MAVRLLQGEGMVRLLVFPTALSTTDGQEYMAQAMGTQRTDGLWEGWIEFVPRDGAVLRSPRETTQPNLTDLDYWATGLTAVYLEGALERALAHSSRAA
jgi:hypothetical protein